MKEWYKAYLESKKGDVNINVKLDADLFWVGFGLVLIPLAIAGKL